MKKSSISISIILLLFVGLFSCTNNVVYELNHDFENEAWHKDSSLVFNVDITDTNQIYHIFFNTRITGQYEQSNLFLFINTDFPNNISSRDTLECILAQPDGKWLGKGFGNIWSNKIAYRKYIKFPYSGMYTFEIEQAMRTDNLPYVLDAGISIEKAVK